MKRPYKKKQFLKMFYMGKNEATDRQCPDGAHQLRPRHLQPLPLVFSSGIAEIILRISLERISDVRAINRLQTAQQQYG